MVHSKENPFFVKETEHRELHESAQEPLSREQQKRVTELVRQLSPGQSHALAQYGADIQGKLARLSDNMLNQMRAQQAEEQIGDVLGTLLDRLRDIQPDEFFAPPRGFLSRLFGSSPEKAKQKLLLRCQKTGYEIERMADTLERLRHQMLRDTTMLDVLYTKNREHFNELVVYIAAAREKLKELQEHTLPALQKKAEASGNDPLQIQELMDMERFTDRLEKKLQDLLISQTIALQTAPQIRLIQENYEMLMEKIRASVLTTIPLWKGQMIILLSLMRQQEQKTIELDAFKETQEELQTVLKETLYIQQEGSAKRRQVEQNLVHIEQDISGKISKASQIG